MNKFKILKENTNGVRQTYIIRTEKPNLGRTDENRNVRKL